MKQTNQNGKFTWAVIFAWIFGIGGVGGVMYLLFTSEDYNGMGGAKMDSSYIAKVDKVADSSNTSSANNSVGYNTSEKNNAEQKTKPLVNNTVPKTVAVPVPKPVVKELPKPLPKPVEKPLPKPVEKVVPKPMPQPKPAVAVAPKPIPATKPVVVVAKTAPKPVVKAIPVAKPVPVSVTKKVVNHAPDKIMSDYELSQLVTRIEKTGDDNAIYIKCVQLHSTSDGNNKKALAQIESYLRSHKYSIAGRETESAHVKGIKVSPANGCMRVVVGSF